MKTLKKVLAAFLIAILTIFSTVSIIPANTITANAATTDATKYFATKTQTQSIKGVPVKVTVSYYYTIEYGIRKVDSISSVSATIDSFKYWGYLTATPIINGSSIYVIVSGNANESGSSNTISIYQQFNFYSI